MKSVAVLLLGFALAGCGLIAPRQPDVEIIERPTPVVCDLTARPDSINLGDTPPTLVLNGEEWGYWFSSELYAVLAENLQAMRRWMAQSTDVRDKLAACIREHNEAVEATAGTD